MQTMTGLSSKSPASNIKPPSFPDWDGEDATKRIWLEKIECFKEAPFFAKVVDWTAKTPVTEEQS